MKTPQNRVHPDFSNGRNNNRTKRVRKVQFIQENFPDNQLRSKKHIDLFLLFGLTKESKAN